jgi:hypothetical protein
MRTGCIPVSILSDRWIFPAQTTIGIVLATRASCHIAKNAVVAVSTCLPVDITASIRCGIAICIGIRIGVGICVCVGICVGVGIAAIAITIIIATGVHKTHTYD